MQWHKYRKWCEENDKPILAVPQGVYGHGGHVWNRNGLLYVDGLMVGPYMVIQRFNGHDVLLRFKEKDNVHRFETLRWKVLEHVQVINDRRLGILKDLKALTRFNPESRTPVVRAVGEVNGKWRYIQLRDDCVSLGDVDVDELGVLDQMATLTRSDEEYRLVRDYYRSSALLERYWSKALTFDACLSVLLSDMNPNKARPWGKPMFDVIINGRTYFITSGRSGFKNASEYWPSPMRRRFSLDNGEGLVELEPKVSAAPF